MKRGFTLIEVLVVLLLMGLFAGMVGVVIRPDDGGLLRLEGERLARLLELAAAEARLSGRAIAWTADESGYRFWRISAGDGWQELRDDATLRARALPRGMRVAGLQFGESTGQQAMHLEFSPHAPPPAFRIRLSLGREHFAVSASPLGDVQVLAEPDTDHVATSLH